MAISYATLAILVDKLKSDLIGSYLNKITRYSAGSFAFALSRPKKAKLVVALTHGSPYITITDQDVEGSGQANQFYLTLKKEIASSLVTNVELAPADRVVYIHLKVLTQSYVTRYLKLVIELVPMAPNLLIIDENDIIVAVWKPSKTLDGIRPLMTKLKYELPVTTRPETIYAPEENKELAARGVTTHIGQPDVGLYFTQPHKFTCLPLSGQQSLSIEPAFIFDHYHQAGLIARLNELYKQTFQLVERKNKQLKQKIGRLKHELALAAQKGSDNEKGQLLLTYPDLVPAGAYKVMIEETEINLDPLLDVFQNANQYFKRYKKSKTALLEIQKQIDLAETEYAYFQLLLQQLQNGNEDDLKEIKTELAVHGYLPHPIKKENAVKAITPYYVAYDGFTIGFGKNNLQNDFLTFNKARAKDYFFHAKDYPGTHVVIFSDNPSPQAIKMAASIALSLAKLTSGEVLLADKKDVKKLHRPGLVKINKYQTLHLDHIDEDVAQLIKQARR